MKKFFKKLKIIFIAFCVSTLYACASSPVMASPIWDGGLEIDYRVTPIGATPLNIQTSSGYSVNSVKSSSIFYYTNNDIDENAELKNVSTNSWNYTNISKTVPYITFGSGKDLISVYLTEVESGPNRGSNGITENLIGYISDSENKFSPTPVGITVVGGTQGNISNMSFIVSGNGSSPVPEPETLFSMFPLMLYGLYRKQKIA